MLLRRLADVDEVPGRALEQDIGGAYTTYAGFSKLHSHPVSSQGW